MEQFKDDRSESRSIPAQLWRNFIVPEYDSIARTSIRAGLDGFQVGLWGVSGVRQIQSGDIGFGLFLCGSIPLLLCLNRVIVLPKRASSK